MSKNNELIEAIRLITQTDDEIYAILGTVEFVDEENLTCDVSPLNDAPDILDVSLIPLDADGNPVKGFVQIPALDSVVIVGMLSNDTGYVSMFSKVDKILINGNDKGGLVVSEDLVTKINNIEKKLNSVLNTISATWVPVPNDGGAALKALFIPPLSTPLTVTQKTDIENKTVFHGDGN